MSIAMTLPEIGQAPLHSSGDHEVHADLRNHRGAGSVDGRRAQSPKKRSPPPTALRNGDGSVDVHRAQSNHKWSVESRVESGIFSHKCDSTR